MMKARIDLLTIITDDVKRLVEFYKEVVGFEIESDHGEYVEFKNEGVRFAICHRSTFDSIHPSYHERHRGHSFELAFPCETAAELDEAYKEIVAKGATPIQPPQDMPWGMRTAFFADPDGNIHELFCK